MLIQNEIKEQHLYTTLKYIHYSLLETINYESINICMAYGWRSFTAPLSWMIGLLPAAPIAICPAENFQNQLWEWTDWKFCSLPAQRGEYKLTYWEHASCLYSAVYLAARILVALPTHIVACFWWFCSGLSFIITQYVFCRDCVILINLKARHVYLMYYTFVLTTCPTSTI